MKSDHCNAPAALKAVIGSYAEAVVADAGALTRAATVLDRLTGREPVFDRGRNAVGAVTTDPTLTLPRLVRELDAAGVPLLDAGIRPPTLDDVFLRLTGESADDAADGSTVHSADSKERAA